MPDNVSLVTVTKTLSAGVATPVLSTNSSRKYLFFQNTGLGGPVTFGTASTVTAGAGVISLDQATAAGGQGGSIEYKEAIPTNPIWAISTTGTTITVSEG